MREFNHYDWWDDYDRGNEIPVLLAVGILWNSWTQMGYFARVIALLYHMFIKVAGSCLVCRALICICIQRPGH